MFTIRHNTSVKRGWPTTLGIMRVLASFVLLAFSLNGATSPCDGVRRTLTAEQKIKLEPIVTRQISRQIDVQSVKVLESFRYRNWYILHIAPNSADEAFVFYKGDPTTNYYLLAWPDAFSENDEKAVLKTVFSGKTKGIPKELATCFAWHVTNVEDKK